MLNTWAQSPGLGVPQGLSASDILAKLYLDPLDRALKLNGISHVRWVDDLRIFCSNHSEAKRTLVQVIEYLRGLGLQVQSAKSYILDQSAALSEIQSVSPVIRRINKRYTEYVLKTAHVVGGDPYMPVFEVDEIVAASDDESLTLDIVVEEIDLMIDGVGSDANSTLLHYLYNRLGKASVTDRWEFLITLLGPRPEETRWILRHLSEVDVIGNAEAMLVAFIASDNAVYDHQIFEIVEWLGEHLSTPDPATLVRARILSRDMSRPWYLTTAARRLLGIGGESADLDHFDRELVTGVDDRERFELAAALRRMERGRRDERLGRIARTDDMVARVQRWIKQNPLAG